MPELLTPYLVTLYCLLAAGALVLLTLLVADVVGLRRGHVPGTGVDGSHDSFHFRSTRAHANINETVICFVLFAALGIVFGAAPAWLNGLSLVYIGARVGHMLFYWLGLGLLRSLAFIVSLVALIGLAAVSGAAALIGQ